MTKTTQQTALRALAALGSGVLWALCFEEQSRPMLSWLALAPLIWLIGVPRGWAWAWLQGFTTWLVAIPWLVPTLVAFGNLPKWLSWILVALLAVYLGAYHAVFATLGRRIWLHGGVLACVGLPALWVVLEWLRGWESWIFNGFPWNLAGYAWIDVPGALPLTAWIGTYGLSFVLVMASVAWVIGLERRQYGLALAVLLVPLNLLPIAGRFSKVVPEDRHSLGQEVRLLQPDHEIVHDAAILERQYQQLITLSKAECRGSLSRRLLIWPESAAWPHAYPRSARLQSDLDDLADDGCDVLLNSASWHGDDLYNSALLVSENGVAATYHKRHLVPYGEYVPFASVLPFVGTLAREAGAFTAGDEVALMPWQGEQIGMAICYEITYPDAVAEQVRAGATILTTITNDAWYGDSSAPWQHYRAARFRAAETRRPLLRAALTGVSGLIGPYGEVADQLGVNEQGVLTSRVAGHRGLTPYVRFPLTVPIACFLLAAFAIVFAIVRGRKA